jgi:hypothetical protein
MCCKHSKKENCDCCKEKSAGKCFISTLIVGIIIFVLIAFVSSTCKFCAKKIKEDKEAYDNLTLDDV